MKEINDEWVRLWVNQMDGPELDKRMTQAAMNACEVTHYYYYNDSSLYY